MKMMLKWWGLLITLLFCLGAYAQKYEDKLAIEYVAKYKDYAVAEMHRVGIPASITLAQGLLESDYGRSRLATLANNHFGAKCHNTWKGPYILHDDDAPQERFRKYESVHESYKDHSKVLAKKRYEFLYDLDVRDYKAWSHGLKKAGYATDPYYGFKLIGLIERYSLFIYDKITYQTPPQEIAIKNPTPKQKTRPKYEYTALEKTNLDKEIPTQKIKEKPRTKIPRYISEQHKVKYNGTKRIVYSHPVMPSQIAEKYNIPLNDVLKYNDIQIGELIAPYQYIYLAPRKSKATRKHKKHTVKANETMKDIGLEYAVALNKLRQKNYLKEGQEPREGEVVFLRKKAPYPPKIEKNTNWTPNPDQPTPEEVQEDLQVLIDSLWIIHHLQYTDILEDFETAQLEAKSMYILDETTPSLDLKIKETPEAKKKIPPVFVEKVDKKETHQIAFQETEGTEKLPPNRALMFPNGHPALQDTYNNEVPLRDRRYHKISEGDTLFSLAEKYKTTVDLLVMLNPNNHNTLPINSLLRVR